MSETKNTKFVHALSGLIATYQASDLRLSKNSWLVFESVSVYICVEQRIIPWTTMRDRRDRKSCVVISNIAMSNDEQGKGRFTRMVETIRNLTSMPLYVQNATFRFAAHLVLNHDWIVIKNSSTYVSEEECVYCLWQPGADIPNAAA
jgi:hypothetical protein